MSAAIEITRCFVILSFVVVSMYAVITPSINFFFDLDSVDSKASRSIADKSLTMFNLSADPNDSSKKYQFIKNSASLVHPEMWRVSSKRRMFDRELASDRHVATTREAVRILTTIKRSIFHTN